jgi:hypothetical protein
VRSGSSDDRSAAYREVPVDAMESSLGRAIGTPGKRVTKTSRYVELLAALTYAGRVEIGGEAAPELWQTAASWQKIFECLQIPGAFSAVRARAALNFVRWWQEEALLSAPGNDRRAFVPTAFETEAHHRVFAPVIEARKVLFEQRRAGLLLDGPGALLPDEYALPCATCGHIFRTAAPRFARTCDACQRTPAYRQRLRPHQLGSLPLFAGGFHKKGSEHGRYVWPTVCEHPECVSVFPAKRWDECYCSDHTRVSATRARQRLARPKHELFRFYPDYSECDEGSEVRFDFVIGTEPRVCVIGPRGYQARDEEEFRPLAFYAAGSHPIRIVAA